MCSFTGEQVFLFYFLAKTCDILLSELVLSALTFTCDSHKEVISLETFTTKILSNFFCDFIQTFLFQNTSFQI